MLLLVLLFTIVGDFIEPVPTIIIFMPLVNALTEAGSINPVHMGVVLIVTLAFGLITPPYGLVLLMASKFVGVKFSHALKAALPIYVVFLATIVFTIFAPNAILWLPKQVMPQAVGCFKNPSGTGYICPSWSQRSGSGMNSLSPGTLAKRPSFQSALAFSMRSFDDDTKFHQMCRGPSIGAPPSSISLAPSPPASTSTGAPAVSTARSPTPSWRSPIVTVPSDT